MSYTSAAGDTYDVDAIIKEWASSTSPRALRATEALLEALSMSPDVPIYDIDKYVESYGNTPRTGKDDRTAKVRAQGLTQRQIRVLELAAAGLTRKEIALAMSLGEETIRNHLSRARYRLSAKNTPHAIAIAMRKRIIS